MRAFGKHFRQVFCYFLFLAMPLTDDALEEVKNVVLSYESSGVIDSGNNFLSWISLALFFFSTNTLISGITLRGFFYLHEAFMQRGRQETAWTSLKAFGYDSSLQLAQNYLYPK